MSHGLVAASVVSAVAPMLAFLGAIWWLDRYDREPPGLVAAVFLWGATGAVALALVGLVLAEAFLDPLLPSSAHPADAARWVLALAPALAEEPAKAVALLAVAHHRHFDNMTDGFVYGAAAGLGFAMTENLLYYLGLPASGSDWGATVALRTFYSAVMHATATALFGAAVARGRFRAPAAFFGLASAGLIAACVVHGTWNVLASSPSGPLFVLDLVLLPALVALVAVLFEWCVLDEARTIRRELRDEAELIPPSHVDVLASWRARAARGWLPVTIDRDRYVRAATDLAMRKRQCRELGARAPATYRADLRLLRAELRELLKDLPRTAPPPGRPTT